MDPVKLPRYVIFQGDNKYNLCQWSFEGSDYLMFNSTNRDLYGSQEVIPVPGEDNVVMIKNLLRDNFWRRDPRSNWIFADKSDKPSTSDRNCLFHVVSVDDETVALECLANGRFLKRFTDKGLESCLSAVGSDYSTDDTARLRVTSALSTRRVFNVRYDTDQIQRYESTPISLGSKTVTNNSSSKADLPVVVKYSVETKYSWRTVTTFNTGLLMSVTAGIPDFATKKVGKLFNVSVENGKMKGEKLIGTKTVIVKDVEPGDSVKVEVTGTQVKAKVPFTYNMEDTRVDGEILPGDTGEDGVFDGVQVLEIKTK